MWNKLIHHPNTPLIIFIIIGISVVIAITCWATREEKDPYEGELK